MKVEKDTENELYYIFLENRYYRHEYDNDDYHLEKIFSKDIVFEILNNKLNLNPKFRDFLIITNDNDLLLKFIICINEDELKMLCRIKEFDNKNIRINKSNFLLFDEKVFDIFNKIKNNEIISASMSWSHSTTYPYDDSSIGIDNLSFEGWVFNKEFYYFETPFRYKKNINNSEIFYLDDIKKGNIEIFKKLININILEIENDPNQNVNWEFRNNFLRYFDRISRKRFYISKELLNLLKNDNRLEFNVETIFDKNHYIEYYVTGIYNEDDEEYIEDELDNDINLRKFEKYNGKYGFNDDTIDGAFDGDPENYWNID